LSGGHREGVEGWTYLVGGEPQAGKVSEALERPEVSEVAVGQVDLDHVLLPLEVLFREEVVQGPVREEFRVVVVGAWVTELNGLHGLSEDLDFGFN